MSETRCFNLNEVETIRVKHGRHGDDSWIKVVRRDGHDGTKWAVEDSGLMLNKQGEWEYEPQPSSRTDAFKKRCRFDAFDEAFGAAFTCKPYVYQESRVRAKRGITTAS